LRLTGLLQAALISRKLQAVQIEFFGPEESWDRHAIAGSPKKLLRQTSFVSDDRS
jgi:hypothetical protein